MVAADPNSATECTGLFGGTDASAAYLAGMISLIKSAYPKVSPVEMRFILAMSSRDVKDPQDKPRSNEWITLNSQGLVHSTFVGFGFPKSLIILRILDKWVPMDAPVTSEFKQVSETVEDDMSLIRFTTVGKSLEGIVDRVVIHFKDYECTLNKMDVFLKSPSGAIAKLSNHRTRENQKVSLVKWTLTTPAFMGESPHGDWILKMPSSCAASDITFDIITSKFLQKGVTSTSVREILWRSRGYLHHKM